MAETYDLIVLGSGPGGYVAAIRAAQLGMKTAVVERESLGGVCLNWGCIPTKALLRTAEIKHIFDHAGDFGFKLGEVSFDMQAVVKRSRKVADQLSRGIQHLMKKNRITVIRGHGRLDGPGKLRVEGEAGSTTLEAPHIIIASGARARTLPGIEPDGKHIWTYREAMVPEAMPKSLIVVGSGAIGIEFASFYRAMGAEVTVVELVDRILPAEDEEISRFAHKTFEAQGMRILTETKLDKVRTGRSGVSAEASLPDGTTETLKAEKLILAVGIAGNVEGIGLDTVKGVKVERGHIEVDAVLRTGEKGIYAIGDVVGAPWLAHKASHEGIICVEALAGQDHGVRIDPASVPGCTYCRPQVASIGLSEAKAKAAGHEIRVGRFPLHANGKAIALGEPEGLVKTIFDQKTGELLGAHMIGPDVTELIQGYTIARNLETTEAELMATIFPHPTLSEAMGEAVLDAYGRVLHI